MLHLIFGFRSQILSLKAKVFVLLLMCVGFVSRKSLWWDTATPYHNVRIEEKEDHDILVVAGENHDSGKKFEEYQDAYSKLEQWAKKRWTSAGEVVCNWTGQASV